VQWYLAQANLTIGGQQILQGHEYELDPNNSDVIDCVTIGFLVAQLPDGTYPSAIIDPTAVRCCGL
jgi:hypothetical protein